MSRSLNIIQKCSKVFKVLTMIVFVCTIIGAVMCFFAMFSVNSLTSVDYEIDGLSVAAFIEIQTGLNVDTLKAICAYAGIICAGQAVTSKIENGYYKKELLDGTPFTYDGAAYLKSCAIKCVVVSICSVVVASIVFGIMQSTNPNILDVDLSAGLSIGWYLFLLFLSAVFNYGAEQRGLNK